MFQASFVASGNRTDISLDDPNFWQKWAKKAEIDIDAISGRVSISFPLKKKLPIGILRYYYCNILRYSTVYLLK